MAGGCPGFGNAEHVPGNETGSHTAPKSEPVQSEPKPKAETGEEEDKSIRDVSSFFEFGF